MHILLTNVHLDCRRESSSNRNASRDESVEAGDESVETGDGSIKAGEKTKQSCYNTFFMYTSIIIISDRHKIKTQFCNCNINIGDFLRQLWKCYCWPYTLNDKTANVHLMWALNSLAPGRFKRNVHAKFSDWWLRYLLWKSKLIQVMSCYHQTTSHYPSQCWARSMSTHGITMRQWVPDRCVSRLKWV